jgi:N utilization substance protein A
MTIEFLQALRDIEREKEIPLPVLTEIVEAALVSAYRKHFGSTGEIHVEIDWDSLQAAVYTRKLVVGKVEDRHLQISLEEARKLDTEVQSDDYLDIEVTPAEFGRIAAQTAKQVVVQRIRETERKIIYETYANRIGDVLAAVVQRRDGRAVYLSVGKTEAILPPSEQIPTDSYRFGERLKVHLLKVDDSGRTPSIVVSRSHPGLVRKLFELEVPEIHEGVVELKSVAREAGARTKVAVASRAENVDPVGACVGHRGSRVQAVVDELNGEKIDIVRWSDDPARFLASALSPAKVSEVTLGYEAKAATVIVPDSQLSLAIGKEGQNVRLAARLTGWHIDIRSESRVHEVQAAAVSAEASGQQPASETEQPRAELPVESGEASAAGGDEA